MRRVLSLIAILAIAFSSQLYSQQTTPKSALPSAAERFAFGKSIYVKNVRGSDIPYDAISSDIQGWGRFVVADSADKADILAEVTSYEGGGISASSKTDYGTDGRPRGSSGTSKDLSASSITLKVYEAKSKRELWSCTEHPKSGFEKKTEQDNLLAAGEKLFLRFHDSIEPPGK